MSQSDRVIQFETAKLANKKKCYILGDKSYTKRGTFQKPMNQGWCISAPTQTSLHKWLREAHNIDVVINPERYSTGINYCVQALKWDLTVDPKKHENFVVKGTMWHNGNGEYTTYELALEKGLQLGLSLI
jgi:hypothetical protein